MVRVKGWQFGNVLTVVGEISFWLDSGCDTVYQLGSGLDLFSGIGRFGLIEL